jgi:dolichyl-diphosphooligosaccharide--protein glycosyltransferase
VEIGNKNFDLTYLEEAYTTEHWLVRIYRVKDLTNRQPLATPHKPIKRTKRKTSKKVRLL